MLRSRGGERRWRRLLCSPCGVCKLHLQLRLQVSAESRPAAVRLTLHVCCGRCARGANERPARAPTLEMY
eukprot:6212164-Pleurochrysis_carterae.AAC.6